MKKYYIKYLVLIFSCFSFCAQAQMSDSEKIARDNLVVSQSSEDSYRSADLAIDDDQNSFSSTKNELNPWYHIELNGRYRVDGIEISHQGLQDMYIFSSKVPFASNDIYHLTTDPWVDYIHIPGIVPNNQVIIIPDFVSEYIMIIRNNESVLSMHEIIIYGDGLPGDGDDGNPEDGLPCDDCPDPEVSDGPGPSAIEICDNGLDDDMDGRTDCDDPDCGVGELTVDITDPSCEGCADGSICINSSFANEVSIDGGQSWIPMNSPSNHCIENLMAGEYSVIARRRESGCETAAADAVLFDGSVVFDCNNSDFEEGTFDGWDGSSGDNNGPGLDETSAEIGEPTYHAIVKASSFSENRAPDLENLPPGIGESFARVGKSTGTGNFDEYGKLSKCVSITSENSEFSLIYAVVMHTPGHNHSEDQLPYFKWQIRDASNNTVVMESDKLSTSSPLLSNGTGNWRFLPWDCQSLDLSDYIGKNMCIEFFGVGCSIGGHAGYAYVDVLCKSGGISPVLESFNVEIDGCEGNIVNIQAESFFYYSYEWKMHRLRNGQKQAEISLGVMENTLPLVLEDVINLYKTESEKTLNCNTDKLVVELHLKNNCGSFVESAEIDIPCISWKAAYPNIFSPLDSDDPDSENDEFFITFDATNLEDGVDPDCSVMGNDISTIYYVRLQIFDRFGELIFDGDKEDLNFNIRGNEPELQWDGTFNGQLVVSGVYSWQLYVGSCGSNFQCQDCAEHDNCEVISSDNSQWTYCSQGKLEKREKKKKEDEAEAEKIWVETHCGTITVI
ncbi:MAG: hypothetical protein MI974_22450 [Chitinophagales bacterium]|nr:hypothetical protein [Chitinophagales bacterium]